MWPKHCAIRKARRVCAAQGRDREMLRRRYRPQRKTFWGGSKKMRQFGRVDIPQQAFIAALEAELSLVMIIVGLVSKKAPTS